MQIVKEKQNYRVDTAGTASLIQESFTDPYPSARSWGGRLRATSGLGSSSLVSMHWGWEPCSSWDHTRRASRMKTLPQLSQSHLCSVLCGISTQGVPDPHGMRLKARGGRTVWPVLPSLHWLQKDKALCTRTALPHITQTCSGTACSA